jgi:hypothetical protein
LERPTVLHGGTHFKVESTKRESDENKVEIIQVTHKNSGLVYEFYASGSTVEIDNNLEPHFSVTPSSRHVPQFNKTTGVPTN